MALNLTKDNFEKQVLSSDKPVLVDFWAEWCQPCKVLGPIIDELAKELKGKVKVAKANVDENQELASKYGIMSIPTVILFKNGKPAEQWIGVQDKSVYVKAINA
jgi:thioredoxin 1